MYLSARLAAGQTTFDRWVKFSFLSLLLDAAPKMSYIGI